MTIAEHFQLEGGIRALLVILEERGLEVSEEHHARIGTCADRGQLEVWIRRALSIRHVDELFETM